MCLYLNYHGGDGVVLQFVMTNKEWEEDCPVYRPLIVVEV
jgi:hypothetical protein